MSTKALTWAREQRTGSPIAKAVLTYLADRANDDGECWPGVNLIAAETEFGRRTVIRALGTLADGGWLTVTRTGKSNVYCLAIGARAAPVDDSQVPERHLRSARAAPEKCQSGTSQVPERHPKLQGSDREATEKREGARKRATSTALLTADWLPSSEGFQFARNEGFNDDQIGKTLDRFTDHYIGTGRRAADWAAVWRNWIREDVRRADESSGRVEGSNGAGPRAGKGGTGGRTSQGDRERALASGLALAVGDERLRSAEGSGS